MKHLISLIIPCYNEAEAIPYFMEEANRIMSEMENQDFEIIFVDDGSKDATLKIAKELAEKDKRIKYLSFSRNFGKEAAILAGLEYAKGDYVALLDADLQDPPDLLPEMYRAVTEDGYESAATRRVTRKGEPPIRSFFARMFYKIINAMTDVEIIDGARDFRFMSRRYVDALLTLKERNRFSKGLFGWVGFRTKWIEFENVERVAGETKWSFWKLFKYSIEGIVAFTTTPLIFSIVVGVIFCIVSVMLAVATIANGVILSESMFIMMGIISAIVLTTGVLALLLGILGLYMQKMYLEIKKRPCYILGEKNVE